MGIAAYVQSRSFPSPYVHDTTGLDAFIIRWAVHGLSALPFGLAILLFIKVRPSKRRHVEMNQQKVLVYTVYSAAMTIMSASQEFIYKFNDDYKPSLIVSVLALLFNLLIVLPLARPFLSKDDSL